MLVPHRESLVPHREMLVPLMEMLVPQREMLVPHWVALAPHMMAFIPIREVLEVHWKALLFGVDASKTNQKRKKSGFNSQNMLCLAELSDTQPYKRCNKAIKV